MLTTSELPHNLSLFFEANQSSETMERTYETRRRKKLDPGIIGDFVNPMGGLGSRPATLIHFHGGL